MIDGTQIYNMIDREAKAALSEMQKHLKLENDALDKNDKHRADYEYVLRMSARETWIVLSSMLARIDVMKMRNATE